MTELSTRQDPDGGGGIGISIGADRKHVETQEEAQVARAGALDHVAVEVDRNGRFELRDVTERVR